MWQLDTARGWWLLLRDILLFALGATVWVYELLLTPEKPPDPIALAAGATAMALPWAFRQDAKR